MSMFDESNNVVNDDLGQCAVKTPCLSHLLTSILTIYFMSLKKM